MRSTQIILIIIALILISPLLMYAGMGFVYGWTEDHNFDAQLTEGYQAANKVLIANGLCPSSNSCSENSVSIYTAGYASKLPNGFKVYIYGTSDNKLLSLLSQSFIDEFNQTPDMKHLHIYAYPLMKQQTLKEPFSWWRNPEIFDLDMRRND